MTAQPRASDVQGQIDSEALRIASETRGGFAEAVKGLRDAQEAMRQELAALRSQNAAEHKENSVSIAAVRHEIEHRFDRLEERTSDKVQRVDEARSEGDAKLHQRINAFQSRLLTWSLGVATTGLIAVLAWLANTRGG